MFINTHCYAEKGGKTTTETPRSAEEFEHSIDPFEFFNWEISESKKGTADPTEKLKHEMEISEKKETGKSHKTLQKNEGISREKGYKFESAPGGRKLESRENNHQVEFGAVRGKETSHTDLELLGTAGYSQDPRITSSRPYTTNSVPLHLIRDHTYSMD